MMMFLIGFLVGAMAVGIPTAIKIWQMQVATEILYDALDKVGTQLFQTMERRGARHDRKNRTTN